MSKSVWIDLDNSPHVPLFLPFIESLEQRGVTVAITARDYAQTIPLLEKYNIKHSVIGKHYGKNKFLKIVGLLIRTFQLIAFGVKHKNMAGLNHGSRSHVLACWVLNIPVYCGLDYEFTESIVFCKFATKIWIPETISETGANHICKNRNKIIRYQGFKEDLYLQNFTPDSSFRKALGIGDSNILITLRPPAELANYHDQRSEEIIVLLIEYILDHKDVIIVFLPRTEEQKFKYQKYVSNSFIIPERPLDGNNLVCHSDLVISGGGTMNREAIVLKTPVYSIFSGEKGYIDAQLEQEGRLKFIEKLDDIKTIRLTKKSVNYRSNFKKRLIVEELLNMLLDN